MSLFWYLTVPAAVVPQLTGSTLEVARRDAWRRGIEVEVSREVFHLTAPANVVVEQSLATGSRVRRGRRIAVTVSKGQNLVPVPYLRARPVTFAVLSLDLVRLQMRVVKAQHDEWINAGAVSRQNPPPGTLVPADSMVTVVVSRGPEPHVMPSLVGLTLRDAEQILQRRRLRLNALEERASDSAPPGVILEQYPAAGRRSHRGTAVRLVVAAVRDTRSARSGEVPR
jgi:serine/threonine-protein kinase